MKITDIERAVQWHVKDGSAGWKMDNRELIARLVIPALKLNPYQKQVMRWAYGLDGEEKSYELESDGETLVQDLFAAGVIKSPAGVAHDYINRVPYHTTPDGYEWTAWQANMLYYAIMRALGYSWVRAFWRWRGVVISKRRWWRKNPE